MKMTIVISTMISLASLVCFQAFAHDGGVDCGNLRFEAQDFICTLEAKLSDDAAGTPDSRGTLKRKLACQESFIKTCKNEIASGSSDGVCEAIQFEAQDFICNLEASESDAAAGTPDFKSALKKKMDCQSAFLKTCSRELNN